MIELYVQMERIALWFSDRIRDGGIETWAAFDLGNISAAEIGFPIGFAMARLKHIFNLGKPVINHGERFSDRIRDGAIETKY